MSIEIARYQFHSWARRGISANITEPDDLGSGNIGGNRPHRLRAGVAGKAVARVPGNAGGLPYACGIRFLYGRDPGGGCDRHDCHC